MIVHKVGCIVYLVEHLVGCLRGSVLEVDIAGPVNKKWVTSGFVLKVMLGGSLRVSGTCIM